VRLFGVYIKRTQKERLFGIIKEMVAIVTIQCKNAILPGGWLLRLSSKNNLRGNDYEI
jgi:hypothetical protein